MGAHEDEPGAAVEVIYGVITGYHRYPADPFGHRPSRFPKEFSLEDYERAGGPAAPRWSRATTPPPAAVPDWSVHALALVEKIRLEGRIARMEMQFTEIAAKLERAEARLAEVGLTPIVVPIATLAPEPFEIISPIHAVLQPYGESYIPIFIDANLGASGEAKSEALDGLKERIISTFERLESKPDGRLGPGPRKQEQVLSSLIRRR